MPVGTRVEQTEKFVELVEKTVQDNVPEVNTIVSDLGVPGSRSGSLFGSNSGSHSASVQVSLVPAADSRTEQFLIL